MEQQAAMMELQAVMEQQDAMMELQVTTGLPLTLHFSELNKPRDAPCCGAEEPQQRHRGFRAVLSESQNPDSLLLTLCLLPLFWTLGRIYPPVCFVNLEITCW